MLLIIRSQVEIGRKISTPGMLSSFPPSEYDAHGNRAAYSSNPPNTVHLKSSYSTCNPRPKNRRWHVVQQHLHTMHIIACVQCNYVLRRTNGSMTGAEPTDGPGPWLGGGGLRARAPSRPTDGPTDEVGISNASGKV